MKIKRLLDLKRPSFSFEFFPPKTEEGSEQLFQSLSVLAPLDPTFVSVTFGAGGSDRDLTLDLVKRIKTEIGIEAMAHLTCVGLDRTAVARILDDLRDSGIENVLALRGDPPRGREGFEATAGGFGYAVELVEFIRSGWDFSVGVAGFPEIHPQSPDAATDIANLKKKVDAGADFVITQLFFFNDLFFRYRDRCEEAGVSVPILAGVMPILNLKQIRRMVEMTGAAVPTTLSRRMEAVEDDPEAVRHIGMYHATSQCLGLLAEGAAGIHFYTLNRSTATRAIFQMLRAGERESVTSRAGGSILPPGA